MPGPAKRRAARAVGLVVARLEDERDAERGGDLLQLAGDVHLQLLGLDDAGAGDQEERLVEADVEAAQFHAATFSRCAAGLVLQRRLDEAIEQRVAVPRRAT